MKYKRLITLVIITVNIILTVHFPDVYADEYDVQSSDLYAQSAVLMDADTGRILFEKDGYTPKPNASTTKILTCILALEYGNREDTVEVSAYAAKMPDVQLNICEGEEYYLGDLLYSLMLESHNDTAVAIAEHIGGTVENFAKMMNEKAKEIGCTSSHFVTPNGLDASDDGGVHSVTAADLALIMRYCIMISPKRDEFLEITRTASYSFTDISGARSYSVSNKNAFLSMMDGALSGKTGFTADAGYCYVGALERDGHTYIVALLACGWPGNKNYKWHDCKLLMNYGIEAFDDRIISDEDIRLMEVSVENGIENNNVKLYASFSEDIILKDTDVVSYIYNIPDHLTAPIYCDSIVGSVEVYINDELYCIEPLYISETIEDKDFNYYINNVLDNFLCQKE